MSSNSMQIVIGAPATGHNFFPRDKISQQLQRALQVEHVLFLAPRRTGKTSVLLDLQRNAPERTLFLNLEEFNHPEQWLNAMLNGLSEIHDEAWQQKLKQAGKFLERVKSKSLEITAEDWYSKSQGFAKDLQQLDEPIWFLLDEFPIMIDQIAKTHGLPLAEAALHWVRCLRQQPNCKVRLLLTGSIGLDGILRKHGIRGVANDLRREELKPLTFEEALAFTLKLASDNHIGLQEDFARDYLQRLGSGLWPFLIQLFVAELQDLDTQPTSPADIERIFHTIARSQRNQYAANMWDRLHDIFTDAEQTIARAVLKLTAAQPTGIPVEQLRGQLPQFETNDFEYVLDVLQHDGYLTETDHGNICFFSNLLRDYWLYKGRV
ncbi:MAG: hypothetical protein CTY16_19295 [Methylobacter sp.]|nr:MAG: hypothetical protein CTY16_19295 [Methylobacter sp.]